MKSNYIYKVLILAIFAAFFLNGDMLYGAFGIPYTAPGGSRLVKFHLYAYLVSGGFLFLVFKNGMDYIPASLGSIFPYWITSVLSILLTMVYSLFFVGYTSIAYFIDTLLIPIIAIPLILELDDQQKENLIKIIAYLILFNSLVALAEFVVKHWIYPAPFGLGGYFRSRAFLGHSLDNALITASLSPLLMKKTKLNFEVYLGIVFCSLLAFGGRSSLFIFSSFALLLFFWELRQFLKKKHAKSHGIVTISLLILFPLILVLVIIIFNTNLPTRIINKLYIDNSARVRFDLFDMLRYFSVNDWIFGLPSSSQIFYLKQKIGVLIIENYVVDWICHFGLLGTIPLILSMTMTFIYSIRHIKASTIFPIGIFLSVSVFNNSLCTKTPALFFLTIILFCLSVNKESKKQSGEYHDTANKVFNNGVYPYI